MPKNSAIPLALIWSIRELMPPITAFAKLLAMLMPVCLNFAGKSANHASTSFHASAIFCGNSLILLVIPWSSPSEIISPGSTIVVAGDAIPKALLMPLMNGCQMFSLIHVPMPVIALTIPALIPFQISCPVTLPSPFSSFWNGFFIASQIFNAMSRPSCISAAAAAPTPDPISFAIEETIPLQSTPLMASPTLTNIV